MYDHRFSPIKVLTEEESSRRLFLRRSKVRPIVLAEPHEQWMHLDALRPGDKCRRLRALAYFSVSVTDDYRETYEATQRRLSRSKGRTVAA